MENEELAKIIETKCEELEKEISILRRAAEFLKNYDDTKKNIHLPVKLSGTVVCDPADNGIEINRMTIEKATVLAIENSSQPMNATEIATEINAVRQTKVFSRSVSVALTRLKSKGLVRQIPGTKPFQWELVEDE